MVEAIFISNKPCAKSLCYLLRLINDVMVVISKDPTSNIIVCFLFEYFCKIIENFRIYFLKVKVEILISKICSIKHQTNKYLQ